MNKTLHTALFGYTLLGIIKFADCCHKRRTFFEISVLVYNPREKKN